MEQSIRSIRSLNTIFKTMKTTSLRTILGGALVGGTLMVMPLAVSALDATATTSSSVRINRDGVVAIVNAEVTSVTGNIINAITRFKSTVVHWAFATNASTTVNVANTTDITNDVLAGDHINVMGTVTTLGTSLGLNATAIKSFAPSVKPKTATSTKIGQAVSGKVTSVNIANGTFMMKASHDKVVTVQTNASTTWNHHMATGTATLARLAVDARVAVVGTFDASGTTLTATQVIAKPENDKEHKENKGSSHGLKNGFKNQEDRDNRGEHKGFLKAFFSTTLEGRSDSR